MDSFFGPLLWTAINIHIAEMILVKGRSRVLHFLYEIYHRKRLYDAVWSFLFLKAGLWSNPLLIPFVRSTVTTAQDHLLPLPFPSSTLQELQHFYSPIGWSIFLVTCSRIIIANRPTPPPSNLSIAPFFRCPAPLNLSCPASPLSGY